MHCGVHKIMGSRNRTGKKGVNLTKKGVKIEFSFFYWSFNWYGWINVFIKNVVFSTLTCESFDWFLSTNNMFCSLGCCELWSRCLWFVFVYDYIILLFRWVFDFVNDLNHDSIVLYYFESHLWFHLICLIWLYLFHIFHWF
jgi:hypothetical protein